MWFYYILEYVGAPNPFLHHIHITLVTLIIILEYVGVPNPLFRTNIYVAFVIL
jgi:hypothetical protein